VLSSCGPNGTSFKSNAAAGGGLSIKPLDFTCKKLANGLRIYAMPDKDTASVSVAVWYNVGSKDDPKGRSGFRAPVRTPDVQVDHQPAAGRIRPADGRCGRVQQRIDVE